MRLKALTSLTLVAWSAIAQAAAPEVFSNKNVSTKSGGEVIYYQLDSSASTDVELTFSANSGEVHVGNIRAITESDDSIPFQAAKIIREIPKDAQGRYILKQGSPTLRIAFSAAQTISVISFRAEATAPDAEVGMKAQASDSSDNSSDPQQPLPLPPPPPGPGSDAQQREIQCQSQLNDINLQNLACNRDTQSATYEKSRTEANVANLQIALDNASQPVRQCSMAMANKRQRYDALVSQAQSLEAELSNLRPRMDFYRRIFADAQANEFECSVMGRHENFRARGRTRAQAMANAINQCGLNNCGKNSWTVSFDCRPVR